MARALLLAGWMIALSSEVAAQSHVIRPGREAEVMALVAPHRLGEEVVGGWVLDGISIDRSVIHFALRSETLRNEGGAPRTAELTLLHPTEAPEGAERTPSFAAIGEGDPESVATRSALLEAVRANDDGEFWDTLVPTDIVHALDSGKDRANDDGGLFDALLPVDIVHALETGEIRAVGKARRSPYPYVFLAAFAVLMSVAAVFLGGPARAPSGDHRSSADGSSTARSAGPSSSSTSEIQGGNSNTGSEPQGR